MLFESDFLTIFGVALIIVVIFTVGFKIWEGEKKDELEKAISDLKINILAIAFLLIVLWFMLPITPSLTTFGFPQTVNDIQSNEQLLQYMQEYNQAIVRTTQVVHWFIFIFVWFFLATLYSVTKTFKSLSKKDNEKDSA